MAKEKQPVEEEGVTTRPDQWSMTPIAKPGEVDIEPGDWVAVRALVLPQGNHLIFEEVLVSMRSHNEDMSIPVLATHVIGKTPPPPDWPRCTALSPGVDDDTYVRCTGASSHSGAHTHPSKTWDGSDAHLSA